MVAIYTFLFSPANQGFCQDIPVPFLSVTWSFRCTHRGVLRSLRSEGGKWIGLALLKRSSKREVGEEAAGNLGN